jgi:endonuclease/exonuclease/phosphatase family metal-dependent hydrolase
MMWVGPSTPRDRARLDRWCDAVGPGIAYTAPEAPPSPADALAVVVWNVHVGGGDLDPLIDALTRGELTNGMPATSFVLLLQEAYRAGADVPLHPAPGSAAPKPIVEQPPGHPRRSAIDVARARGLAIVYVPSMRNARLRDADAQTAEDRGNAIVSTWPLTDPMAIELPFERQRRVAVAATVSGRTINGATWTVRAVTVHLDTTLAFTRGGPLSARRRQADALVDAIGASALPTVAGGDFNAWLGDSEPAISILRRAFPQTPRTSAGATWHGPLGTRAALDRLFVSNLSGAVSIRRVPDRFGSDHNPLVAIVHVRASGEQLIRRPPL